MKILGLLVVSCLLLAVPSHAASRYAECSANCKAIWHGKMHDKETPMGACDRGCQAAHWNGKDRGKSMCGEMFARSTVEVVQACRYGADRY